MAINAVTVALSPRTWCTRCPRPKKMQKQMAINAATVALSPRTCSIRCPAPKKCSRKLQSMPQRSYCHRERAPYDAPPEKRSSKCQSKRQRSHCHRERVAYDAPPEKNEGANGNQEKICCRGRGTKQRIWTSRQTSSVTYICGHRLLHIRRKAGESRNARSPPKEAYIFLPRPLKKTANFDFKANLDGHLYMRSQASSHCKKSK